jgi:hypothetical protein
VWLAHDSSTCPAAMLPGMPQPVHLMRLLASAARYSSMWPAHLQQPSMCRAASCRALAPHLTRSLIILQMKGAAMLQLASAQPDTLRSPKAWLKLPPAHSSGGFSKLLGSGMMLL